MYINYNNLIIQGGFNMQKKCLMLCTTLLLALGTSFSTCNASENNVQREDSNSIINLNDNDSQDSLLNFFAMPFDVPPDNIMPPGPPPNGGPMPDNQNAPSANSLKAAYLVDGKNISVSKQTLTATEPNENTVLVRNNGNLTMTNTSLEKSGDSDNGEDSNFSGRNAVFLVNNSSAQLSDITISSAAEGSNAIFATGKKSHIIADHIKIYTTENSSRGLDATYGGTISANDVEIATEGAHCAALATDRGEGNVIVTKGRFYTSGEGSPCIYSTGNIEATNCKGIAMGSEIAVVEGKNSIVLDNCQLTGSRKQGVMLYQSFSGDAGNGTASFTAKNSELTNLSDGPMFYITNTKALASLENTALNSKGTTLIQVTSDHWGRTNANGGNFTFEAKNQQLQGDILANSLSDIYVKLNDGTSWTGAFNKDHEAHTADITLATDACWELTADSYVNVINDAAIDFNNIKSHGYSIYYNSDSNKKLKDQTYSLNGGGKLIPKQP
jgi:hypothetical protein